MRLLEIVYFQYIIEALPLLQRQKISFKKIPSFPDNRIMVWLQIHVPPNAFESIINNCDFSMLIDIHLTKDFALGAEYDTMNTIQG
jgi:hypothetical protein